jgi:phage shock protein A
MGSIIGTPLSGPPTPPSDPPPPPQQYQQPPYQQPYPPPPTYQIGAPRPSGGWKMPVLFVAVVVLLAATVGLFYYFNSQMAQLRADLGDRFDALQQQISKTRETSNVSTATARRNVENLQKELAAARAQASQLAGQAKADATKHAEDLASKLEQAQEQQAKRVTAVAADVSQVKDQATATQGKVGEVTDQVGTLKTEQASTRQELEKTISDLKRTTGDLGVTSGLVATNSKELSALKALGERNYTEFKLAKEKTPTKVGDIQIKLKNADPKKNRYTIDLIADDKTVEKKDRTTNEPLQFYLSRAAQPYELVVNEVRKDVIVGYISAPKVQQARPKAQAAN